MTYFIINESLVIRSFKLIQSSIYPIKYIENDIPTTDITGYRHVLESNEEIHYHQTGNSPSQSEISDIFVAIPWCHIIGWVMLEYRKCFHSFCLYII